MECCRYLVFHLNDLMKRFKTVYIFLQLCITEQGQNINKNCKQNFALKLKTELLKKEKLFKFSFYHRNKQNKNQQN